MSSDLSPIVKSEPTTDHNDISTSSNPKNPPIENPNPTQLSLIPSLPTQPSSSTTTTCTQQHPHNPFGPSYTHNKSIHHTIPPFPPPFSNHPIPPMPNIYPPPTYPGPPMPFQHTHTHPHTHTHTPYPVPNPMFYPPVFHYNQPAIAPPPPPPSHHYDNSDSKTTHDHESSTTPPVPSPTQTNTKNTNKSKPYSFTPGMQPGAYYLIPLNTPNGHGSVSNQNNGHAYMPLINGGPSNTKNVPENHKNVNVNVHVDMDTSSATSSEDSESDSDSDSNDEHSHTQHVSHVQTNTLHSVYNQTPFLNVVSPINQAHLPFPIPLTPNNNASFPPPLPLPYDIGHISNTQFSLAPIINTNNNRVLPEKHNGNSVNEDKKNILNKNKHDTVLQTSFMMPQPPPIHINNIASLTSQPLSFPPLPTNNSMNQPSHLNSNFAGQDLNDLDDDIEDNNNISTMLSPDRDDSSDHDMDVALGTHQMPIIQNNNTNTHNHNHKALYHNITPFDGENIKKKKRKTRVRHKSQSPKKNTKKSRKHIHKKKVSNKTSSNCNNYQDISVAVPALNKMNVSVTKLAHNATTNGRRITNKKRNKCKNKKTQNNIIPPIPDISDIPDLSDTNDILIPPAITNIDDVEGGSMDVAYSQQYPQVGFPFIYNAQGENGKKFTCKFMDSNSSTSMTDCELQFCDRQFGQKCHWMRHCLEKHVPTEMSQRYQCRYCNMKYAQNSSLKEHVAICHSNKPPSFKCPYCSGDITFTRWTSVLRHCRNQHPDQEEPSKQLRAKSLRVNHNHNHNHVKKKKKNVKRNNDNVGDGDGGRRMRRNHNHNHNHNHNGGGGSLMDIDGGGGGLSAMNIMPSVNMNISMNQMLSNNYIANVGVVPANVAILPPDLSHSNGIR